VFTAVFAALAQEESRLISERTKAGMALARAAGRPFGPARKEINVLRLRRLRQQGL